MHANADARPATKFDWCAGPGKGPVGKFLSEINFRKNDKAKYMFCMTVDDAALWLSQHGRSYECCTQRGFPGPVFTSFWGPGRGLDGKRELVACYDAETKELAVWNTGAYLNPEARDLVKRAGGENPVSDIAQCEIVDDLFAGII